MTRGVAILGSTGSIGTQALDVLSHHRDEYRVVALAAGRDSDLLAQQAAEFDVPRDKVRVPDYQRQLRDIEAARIAAGLPHYYFAKPSS